MSADVKKSKTNEHGGTLVEYALLASLIALVVLVSLRSLGQEINNSLCEAHNGLAVGTASGTGGLSGCVLSTGNSGEEDGDMDG